MPNTIQRRRRQETLLIVPFNDAEAAMIIRLAQGVGMNVLVSSQPHGARLEKEPRVLSRIKASGKSSVCVVEMPGPRLEKKVRQMVKDFTWIDHHQYDFLDRAHDPKTGKEKSSSLEQFITYFGISDAEMRALGLKPRLVKGIGVMDRAFIWGLRAEGFSRAEVKQVMNLTSRLVASLPMRPGQPSQWRIQQVAARAWKQRTRWNAFWIVRTRAHIGIRPVISLLSFATYDKPTPLIISERDGDTLYVQETPLAASLFKKLGGFTFGGTKNWGFDNTITSYKLTIKDVQRALIQLQKV